jgi:hypothetical protein
VEKGKAGVGEKKSRFSLGTKRRRVMWVRDKIGKILVKNARDRHVGGMPSKLPEKVNGRFVLQVFETSGDKLSTF